MCVKRFALPQSKPTDISKVQDDEVGDGTTSVTVLACELLRVSVCGEGGGVVQLHVHTHVQYMYMRKLHNIVMCVGMLWDTCQHSILSASLAFNELVTAQLSWLCPHPLTCACKHSLFTHTHSRTGGRDPHLL